MNTIISVADPVGNYDAANKQYVDNEVNARYNSKLSTLLSDPVISSFCDAVSSNGIDSVVLSDALSAMYNFMNIVRESAR